MTGAERLLTRARAQLIIQQPFFGTLALRLRLTACGGMGTLATDGVRLLYDPAYVERLAAASRAGEDQLRAVVAHEVLHCVFGHPWRINEREALKWNVAADLGVNPVVVEAGMTLPAGGLFPALFKLPDGLYAEEYYSRLPQQKSAQCAGCSATGIAGHAGTPGAHSHGGCSGVRPLPASGDSADGSSNGMRASAADIAQAASNWKIATVQAAQAARQAGKLPASIARMVDELIAPTVDWKEVLRRFITTSLPADYRLFPPNRRFIWQNLYLPSVQREGVGVIVIAIDTSGSVGPAELQAFMSEINGIAEDARPERIHVVCCDAEMGSEAEFGCDDLPIRVDIRGGGGTAFEPVFAWVEERGISPQCLIYLTDMYPGSWPDEPDYPVLWAAVTDVVGPWGETVRVRIGEAEEE